MAHASKQARESSATTHITKKADKKKSTATTKKTQKQRKKPPVKVRPKAKPLLPLKNLPLPLLNAKTRSKHAVNKTASASFTEKCTKRKEQSHCVKSKMPRQELLPRAQSEGESYEVERNKLMQQIGKPYRWVAADRVPVLIAAAWFITLIKIW